MSEKFKNKVTFNDKKEIITMETPLGEILHFNYDDKGRMNEITNDRAYLGMYTYIDDDSNKLKNFSDTDGVEIVYAYEGDELYAIVVFSVVYNNQFIILDNNTLLPIKGKDTNGNETLRIIDDTGYIVDYCTNLNRKKSEVYGIKSKKYEINKVDDETIEVSYDKKMH